MLPILAAAGAAARAATATLTLGKNKCTYKYEIFNIYQITYIAVQINTLYSLLLQCHSHRIIICRQVCHIFSPMINRTIDT